METIRAKLVLETQTERHTWESIYADNSAADWIKAFYGLMVAATFSPEGILRSMEEFVEERLETDKEK